MIENKKCYQWKTPAQSPDMNPIEHVLNYMKSFLLTKVKPNS